MSSGIFFAKNLLQDAAPRCLFPESGETASLSSPPSFAYVMAEITPDRSVGKGKTDKDAQERCTNTDSGEGRRDRMWGESRKICFDSDWPYEACLRQGLLSLSVAAQSQVWQRCYGNDLVQRRQAG